MWWEMPESHQGTRPRAVKKSATFSTRVLDHTPMASITKKYPPTTTQSSADITTPRR
jgi:hypothetical protein